MHGDDPATLANQFIFAERSADAPPTWKIRELNGWWLASHPSLKVTPVQTPAGIRRGWALGIIITDEDGVLEDALVLRESEDADPADSLRRLRGRFVIILLDSGRERIYPDAAASLSLVFGSGSGPAAATPGLFDDQRFPSDTSLVNALGMPNSGNWYAFGLTPRRGVERLLPNHFLDLKTWRPVRYWPVSPLMQDSVATQDSVLLISTRLRRTINAVASRWQFHLPLTAGQDSRVLLGAARDVIAKMQCFVMAAGRRDLDVAMARRLARRARVKLDVLPVVPGTEDDFDTWMYRTGGCVTGRIARDYVTLAALKPRWALLPGMGGEVGRGFYWREEDFRAGTASPEPLTPETAVRRIKLPLVEPVIERATVWLAGLARQNRLTLLDLLYIEQRLGCWAGPQQYGIDPFVACHLSPFTDRVIFETMLSLPVPYRRAGRLARDLCRQQWPDIAELPFNEWPGLRGRLPRMRRFLSRLGRFR